MKGTALLVVVATLFGGAFLSESALAEVLPYPTITNTGDFSKLEEWLNNACKPDRMDDINAVYSQANNHGGNYNVSVKCQQGSGLLGHLKIQEIIYKKGEKDINAINDDIASQSGGGVLLLLYGGSQDKNSYYFVRKGR